MDLKNFIAQLWSLTPARLAQIVRDFLLKWKKNIQTGVTAGRTHYLLSAALIVGFVAGLTAYIFHLFIEILSHLTIGHLEGLNFTSLDKKALWLFTPAVGGLIAGLLIFSLKPEYRLQGVPEVIHSLLRRAGRMKIRATILKSWGAVLTLGSGGSAGPEGPIAEIGASTGSFLGRILSVPPQIMRMLVAGGAAGGIAASFHAPIGGVFFALEVLLAEFTPHAFSLVVLSSVTATLVSRSFMGGHVYFSAPVFPSPPAWELVLYAVLGILSAFVAKAYIQILDGAEELFKSKRMGPVWFRPAVGGMLVGGIALLTPQVLGTGHSVIEQSLWGSIPFNLLLALFLAKIIATGFTIGSGGVGGVFLPGFFVGAMLGGAYGHIVRLVLGNFGVSTFSSPGAFALVGMAALLAGSTRAPMTSVIIIFEITNDYQMILPVMIAVVLSTMITRTIEERTIYTHHLSLRGLKEPHHRSIRAIESTMVEDVMTKKVLSVSPSLSLDRLARLVETKGHSGFPVVDDEKKLVGLVTFEELRNALGVDDLPHSAVVTGDLMRTPPATIFPDQTISEALAKFNQMNVDRLAVVSRADQANLLGIVTQSDVLSIYRKLLV